MEMAKRTAQAPWTRGNRLVGYDLDRRRIWIGGQRVHHGVTGLLVAGAGLAGLAARRFTTSGGLQWTLLGTALVAHDWHDRSVWFERGPQY
jgi:hypothetical protein